MTQKTREEVSRAIGILEGIAWFVKLNVGEALNEAIETLEAVLQKET